MSSFVVTKWFNDLKYFKRGVMLILCIHKTWQFIGFPDSKLRHRFHVNLQTGNNCRCLNGGENTAQVLCLSKKGNKWEKPCSPTLQNEFDILQLMAQNTAVTTNYNRIVSQDSPDTFHTLFQMLFVCLLCFLPSQRSNPLRRNLLSFSLLFLHYIGRFTRHLCKSSPLLEILERQNCNLWRRSNIKTGAVALNSGECERLNTTAEAQKWISSSPHTQTHKASETSSLSFPLHTHTLLLFIIFDGYLRCQIQLCVVLLAVQHNANPTSWKTILLRFSLYFSFYSFQTKCLCWAIQARMMLTKCPVLFNTTRNILKQLKPCYHFFYCWEKAYCKPMASNKYNLSTTSIIKYHYVIWWPLHIIFPLFLNGSSQGLNWAGTQSRHTGLRSSMSSEDA